MRDNRCGAEITVQSTCSTHWSTGIVHGTCGHLVKDDATRKQEVHLIRAFTSAKAGHTVAGTGRKKVAKNSTRLINFIRGVAKRNVTASTTDSPRQVLQKNDDRIGSI